MSFSESIKICFNKYVVFRGTASRSEFWWFQLFTLATSFIFRLYVPGLAGLVSLAFLLPSLAVSVRRNHDAGFTGWLVIVPICNFILWLLPSKVVGNKYAEAATTPVWSGTPQGDQFCSACGKLLQGGLNFCPACGTSVSKS